MHKRFNATSYTKITTSYAIPSLVSGYCNTPYSVGNSWSSGGDVGSWWAIVWDECGRLVDYGGIVGSYSPDDQILNERLFISGLYI